MAGVHGRWLSVGFHESKPTVGLYQPPLVQQRRWLPVGLLAAVGLRGSQLRRWSVTNAKGTPLGTTQVCTDVAARGLDVADVLHVVQVRFRRYRFSRRLRIVHRGG
jgi:hypothetical protein